MVIIRGMYETAELCISVLGCEILFVTRCNILPMRLPPDLTSALFLFSTVLLLNSVRVRSLAPLDNMVRFLLELLAIYMSAQLAMVAIWEPFCYLLQQMYESYLLSGWMDVVRIKNSPKMFVALKKDFFFVIKLAFMTLVTYKTLSETQSLDYILPWRRHYQYFPMPTPELRRRRPSRQPLPEDKPEKRRGRPKLADFLPSPSIDFRPSLLLLRETTPDRRRAKGKHPDVPRYI